MNFVSDNAGPAHPKVMEAVIRANEGAAMPYGNDPLTAAASPPSATSSKRPRPRSPSSPPAPRPTRSALACLVQPYDRVFCSRSPISSMTNAPRRNSSPVARN
jgi:threonine aldolase